MSVRNILVAFNGSDSSVSALRYAASLAQHNQAHVSAVLAHADYDVLGRDQKWIPAAAKDIIDQANNELVDRIETSFEQLRGELELGDRLSFFRSAGRVDTVLSEHARSYDLLVIGQDRVGSVDQHVVLHPDRIALLSGTPLLIVPQGHSGEANISVAALAWDGGRAASRALSDSLHLLEDEAEMTVLTVDSGEPIRPANELITHLSRHGIAATQKTLTMRKGVSDALLDYCRDTPVGLLVMGAYEHSKFREDFLGGVTATLLATVPVPILMSH